jgi:hypothetical protein
LGFHETPVDAVDGDLVEQPVIRSGVEPPVAAVGEIGETGSKLVAQQPEQPVDDVGAGLGVGGDRSGPDDAVIVQ